MPGSVLKPHYNKPLQLPLGSPHLGESRPQHDIVPSSPPPTSKRTSNIPGPKQSDSHE